MLRRSLAFFFFLLVSVECQLDTGSGIVVGVGSTLISEFGKEIGFLCDHSLKGLKFPDISGEKKHGYPHIRYSVTEIIVTTAQCGVATATAVPPSSATFDLNHLDIEISSHLDAKQTDFPYLHAKGRLTIHIEKGGLSVDLSFGATDGKPTLSGSARTRLDTHLHFKGTDDGIVEPLLFLLKPIIDGVINKKIDSLVKTETAKATASIAKIPNPDSLTKNHTLGLDWGLIAPPEWSNGVFSFQSHGQFGYGAPGSKNFNYTMPFRNNNTLPKDLGKDQLQIIVGDYALNSFLYSEYQDGKMKWKVTPSEIPKSVPIKLNTTAWKKLIPQFDKKYPAHLFDIDFSVAYYPKIMDTYNSSIGIDFPLDLGFFVLPEKRTAFTLRMQINLEIMFAIETDPKNASDWHIFGKLSHFKPLTMHVVNSNIGKLDIKALNTILYDLGLLAPPIINKALKKGKNFPKTIHIGKTGKLKLTELAFVNSDAHGWFGFEASLDLPSSAFFTANHPARVQPVELDETAMFGPDPIFEGL